MGWDERGTYGVGSVGRAGHLDFPLVDVIFLE
jgi:hypothetical protein